MLVFLHGGGLTAMSWAVCAKHVRTLLGSPTVQPTNKNIPNVVRKCSANYETIAFDLRGHGETQTNNDLDLSIDTLVTDVTSVLTKLCENRTSPVPIVLIGHSLGGSVATRVASKVDRTYPFQIAGLVVVDIVEGTAMASIENMKQEIAKRPTKFSSLPLAVRWSLESGQQRHVESALISIPSQLVQENNQYRWRTDLTNTIDYWPGWYDGLSNSFLSYTGPKLLLLANTNRLDKDLMIAQMQGKFNMQVMTSTGHFMQEDEPDNVAAAIVSFLKRFAI